MKTIFRVFNDGIGFRYEFLQQDKLNHHERSQLKQYKTENQRLKKIIADQALEIERKEEELKKTNYGQGKR